MDREEQLQIFINKLKAESRQDHRNHRMERNLLGFDPNMKPTDYKASQFFGLTQEDREMLSRPFSAAETRTPVKTPNKAARGKENTSTIDNLKNDKSKLALTASRQPLNNSTNQQATTNNKSLKDKSCVSVTDTSAISLSQSPPTPYQHNLRSIKEHETLAPGESPSNKSKNKTQSVVAKEKSAMRLQSLNQDTEAKLIKQKKIVNKDNDEDDNVSEDASSRSTTPMIQTKTTTRRSLRNQLESTKSKTQKQLDEADEYSETDELQTKPQTLQQHQDSDDTDTLRKSKRFSNLDGVKNKLSSTACESPLITRAMHDSILSNKTSKKRNENSEKKEFLEELKRKSNNLSFETEEVDQLEMANEEIIVGSDDFLNKDVNDITSSDITKSNKSTKLSQHLRAKSTPITTAKTPMTEVNKSTRNKNLYAHQEEDEEMDEDEQQPVVKNRSKKEATLSKKSKVLEDEEEQEEIQKSKSKKETTSSKKNKASQDELVKEFIDENKTLHKKHNETAKLSHANDKPVVKISNKKAIEDKDDEDDEDEEEEEIPTKKPLLKMGVKTSKSSKALPMSKAKPTTDDRVTNEDEEELTSKEQQSKLAKTSNLTKKGLTDQDYANQSSTHSPRSPSYKISKKIQEINTQKSISATKDRDNETTSSQEVTSSKKETRNKEDKETRVPISQAQTGSKITITKTKSAKQKEAPSSHQPTDEEDVETKKNSQRLSSAVKDNVLNISIANKNPKVKNLIKHKSSSSLAVNNEPETAEFESNAFEQDMADQEELNQIQHGKFIRKSTSNSTVNSTASMQTFNKTTASATASAIFKTKNSATTSNPKSARMFSDIPMPPLFSDNDATSSQNKKDQTGSKSRSLKKNLQEMADEDDEIRLKEDKNSKRKQNVSSPPVRRSSSRSISPVKAPKIKNASALKDIKNQKTAKNDTKSSTRSGKKSPEVEQENIEQSPAIISPPKTKAKKSGKKTQKLAKSPVARSQPIESEEDGVRRSKRVRVDKNSKPVYEYTTFTDYQGKMVVVSNIVSQKPKVDNWLRFVDKEAYRRKEIFKKKKESKERKSVKRKKQEESESDQDVSKTKQKRVTEQKENKNAKVIEIVGATADKPTTSENMHQESATAATNNNQFYNETVDDAMSHTQVSLSFSEVTKLNTSQETVILQDVNESRIGAVNTKLYCFEKMSLKRTYESVSDGVSIWVCSHRDGIIKIAKQKATKTNQHEMRATYFVQGGECICSINNMVSRHKNGDVIKIPYNTNYKIKNISNKDDLFLYFFFNAE